MTQSQETSAKEAGTEKNEAAKTSARRTGAGRPLDLAGGMCAFLAAGLVGGALAWAVVQHFDEPFPRPAIASRNPSPEQLAAVRRAEFGNVAFVFAVFGAIVSAGFVVTEGIARKRPVFAALGLLVAAGLGGAFGAGAGAAVKIAYEYPLPDSWDDWIRNPNFPFQMVKTMAVHGIGWGIVGLGIGLGLALPTGRARVFFRAPFAALIGGMISALVYGFVVALLFKTAQTDLMVPRGTWNRLAWFLVTAGLMGLVVGGLGKSPKATLPASDVKP